MEAKLEELIEELEDELGSYNPAAGIVRRLISQRDALLVACKMMKDACEDICCTDDINDDEFWQALPKMRAAIVLCEPTGSALLEPPS